MTIQYDWQIVDDDAAGDEPVPVPGAPPPPRRPSFRLLIAALGMLALAAALVAGAVALTYRSGQRQADEQVRALVRLEAQAIAHNDRDTFLALQDPQDAAWRTMQQVRFGRLESVGLPEFGWDTRGAAPQFGSLALEPGGARLDATYHLSVTQPLPGGPTSVTIRVPYYYRRTSSGWVHAMPGQDYWGPWRMRVGKHFAAAYAQRDAEVIEPLVPRMDEILVHACADLPCPAQPLYVSFDHTEQSLIWLQDFSQGLDNGFMLHLPSPQLLGAPADQASRDEYYRAIATHVVQALLFEASSHRLNTQYAVAWELLRWEMAQVGLAGPLIGDADRRALAQSLQTGWTSLNAVPLRRELNGVNRARDDLMLPMALAFLKDRYGSGAVVRLIPALATQATLGSALISGLGVSGVELESAWVTYLRGQATDMASTGSP